MSEKLLLIDTFYFLHRSFHAYPKDLQADNGEYTNVVFGFSQSLLDSISALGPTHIACSWETEEQPSFRKELYPEYQITRASMEPDDEMIFTSQFRRVIQVLEAFNIPRLVEEGFEGDDVLGTASHIAAKDMDVVISTSDQDLLQLITDKINVFRPARPPFVSKKLFDAKEFEDKYGFEPELMIDYKALRGDPSDNIPGVKGVGDKTATQLIQEYGSLEKIYDNLENIKESVKKKLETDKENAFLSKQLATIITDIPMEFDVNDAKVHDFDVNLVRNIFHELGFNSLMKKLDKLEKVKDIKEKIEKKNSNKEVDDAQISLL